MDVIESIKKDKAYLKSKIIVKNWEKEFKIQNARTPSKFDIKEAPPKIKFAYKKYFQLKSSALENSLCDNDFEKCESFGSQEMVAIDDVPNVLSPNTEQILETLPSGEQLVELIQIAKEKECKNTIQDQHKKSKTQFTQNLSKKLFESRKFSFRNPRKLPVQNKEASQENIENDTSILLPKLPENSEAMDSSFETEEVLLINEQKNCSDAFAVSTSSLTFHSGENTHGSVLKEISRSFEKANHPNIKVREINEAWLCRATGSVSNMKSEMKTESFGMRNVKISSIEKTCDYVENSESESDDSSIGRLKPALKKRKYGLDFKTGTVKKELVSNANIDNKYLFADSNEKDQKKYESTKTEQLPDISEFLPFGLDNEITPRHASVTNTLREINAPKAKHNKKSEHTNDETSRLENKINSGTLNENFVKINIEKKVFVRGKKNMNYSKYKKQQWKNKKNLNSAMEFPESGKISCFKCGLSGHMARYCTAHRGDSLLPLDNLSESNESTPTLEEMAIIASTNRSNVETNNTEKLMESLYKAESVPESFMKLLANTTSHDKNIETKPIYSDCHANGNLEDILKLFGHNEFRCGQKQAIMRILCGMSTLLVLSTGGGKSLCYQIPAYVYSQHYKCITLVISPLVSLMDDQVLSMPDFLKAGCLHTSQPPTQRQKIMQLIKDGDLNILLISPEALIAGDSSSGFAGLFKYLPPIAFACIDEAHCVSQWSHNFRPSYLMLCRVLREKLKVKCILGLTATASQSTVKSVIDHINIPDGLSGVITNPAVPDNLSLSVSFERDKDRALVSFLSNETINSTNSIIVYCIRRDECERVAAVLRSSLQEPGTLNMEKQTKKRKRISYIAEAYHAGMSAAHRRKIQNIFMNGSVRIIVATVAFGMGINKSDIRCIIHYNMPSNFESYVQEIGRAGRDGLQAYCHAFLTHSNSDKNEMLRHIHSNSVDRPTIRKLLEKVFIPCDCPRKCDGPDNTDAQIICKGHEVGIPIDLTVEELDLPSENISTILCYLELHPKNYIKILNNTYTMCKIIAYGSPQKIIEAAKSCRPLAMAYVMESKKNKDVIKKSILEFNVIEVSSAIGWDSGMVKYHLKNLEWTTAGGKSIKSQLKVEFNTLGFKVKAPGDLSASELDKMLDDLHNCVLAQEKTMLYQLEEINTAFAKLGNNSIEKNDIESLAQESDKLKAYIRQYFNRENVIDAKIELEERPLHEDLARADIKALITSYKDCSFTGRSIARIFQGISSPNFPAIVWGRCKFWRAHIHEDFYGLIRLATQELLHMKMI